MCRDETDGETRDGAGAVEMRLCASGELEESSVSSIWEHTATFF